MKKVLFVCTGNTCRSSMAEAIAKKILVDEGMNDEISVSSAGINAIVGDKASHQAVQVMEEWGIDLTCHKARQLSMEIVDEANLILTMTSTHKNQIIRMNPKAKNKVYTLIEFADGVSSNISDPFGQCADIYRECAVQLKDYIRRAMGKLI